MSEKVKEFQKSINLTMQNWLDDDKERTVVDWHYHIAELYANHVNKSLQKRVEELERFKEDVIKKRTGTTTKQ